MDSAHDNVGHTTLSASQYLQDRLQDRRARDTRPKRARQTDFGPRRGLDDDIFLNEAEATRCSGARLYDNSPIVGGSRRPSAVAGRNNGGRASLGVRDVDEQLDRLHKENFAMKLELDHRRDRETRMQEQMEAMKIRLERVEVLEEEHAELLRINTQLVEELERRDKAVEEAVDTICELEEKMADMEESRSHTRPSTAQADSGYAGTETQEQVPSSPPEIKLLRSQTVASHGPVPAASLASQKLQSIVGPPQPVKARREPSFMTLKKQSTHALRSVYLESTHNLLPVQSFTSLLSRRDGRIENDSPDDILDSPRLSVLSESSFPSIYSPKKQISPDKYVWEGPEEGLPQEQFQPRQDSIKRVSQWMEEHDALDDTPSKISRNTTPMSSQTDRTATPSGNRPIVAGEPSYHSLTEALAASLPPGPRPAHIDTQYAPRAPQPRQPALHRTKRQAQNSMYSDPLLPPTPDSVSTHMLRASRSSIAGDRSLLDTTPVAVEGFAALEPGVRTAPKQFRSSVELHSAYLNYQQYGEGEDDRRVSDSSFDEEDEGGRVPLREVRDHSLDYDGFPDGASILGGTPSRFLKHGRPTQTPTLFDPNNVSPTAEEPRIPIPHRRQSISDAAPTPRKPSINRAETSPTFLGTLGRIMTNHSRSTIDTITSPRSLNSGSSGARTIIQSLSNHSEPSASTSSLRPESRTSRASASPARRPSLSQRTQSLIRRMSNSHSQPTDSLAPGSAEPRSPREKSPLPTLTSTPSSAYVGTGNGARPLRRPSTSQESKINVVAVGEGRRRPSLQPRTQTEPGGPVRPGSAAFSSTNASNMKAGGSTKEIDTTRSNGLLTGELASERTNGRQSALARRAGSIREAVGARRPWR
ncbi:hypothetical protein LTR62_000007 [Meristemomyces frigidus]|uniref:Centrosomin N-terminal motif 1 domain-containing protein n=1 Tax=Meristemomyces frigidus TaxID=1508187 RepID=A0AAN7YST6_9PEZI|nr:hypothetical protein LTR62_000007 [Meristemomyces frigidus]